MADGPAPAPMPSHESLSGTIEDPALSAKVHLPPPARLKKPAVLASVAACGVAAAAHLSEAPPLFAILAGVLGLAAALIALRARA